MGGGTQAKMEKGRKVTSAAHPPLYFENPTNACSKGLGGGKSWFKIGRGGVEEGLDIGRPETEILDEG